MRRTSSLPVRSAAGRPDQCLQHPGGVLRRAQPAASTWRRSRAASNVAGRCPGRFERVDEGQPFMVVVDYAHTDDALRNVIRAARELSPRRVITLFGCGGDRDRTKRPLMGEAAAELSDFVVLTSDNPRSEDPLAIMNDAMVGVRRYDTPSRRRAGPRESHPQGARGSRAGRHRADRRQGARDLPDPAGPDYCVRRSRSGADEF